MDMLRLRPQPHSRCLRLSTVRTPAVDYGRNEIVEHVENRATENQDDGNMTVHPRR